MSKIPSNAESAMLEYWREYAGLSIQDVADHFGLAEHEVRFWELGETIPSLAELKKIAKYYKKPTALFYLSKRPKWTPPKDYRRLPVQDKNFYSKEMLAALHTIQGRQEWLAEYFEEQGRESLPFVGSASINDGAAVVGARLRALLGVSLSEQRIQQDKKQAFRLWRTRCEDAGVYVFLTRKVDIHEMRGFALPHPLAPVVAVNDHDFGGGRIFTLMHEMAHILLNIPGVSDRKISSRPRTSDQKTEAFCNAVAAEALVPGDDFSVRASRFEDDYEKGISILAGIYRVSDDVIARKMMDQGLITKDHYEKLHEEFSEVGEIRRESKGGGTYLTTALSSIGHGFGRTVISAYHDDSITGSDVADLLDMKLGHLPKVEAAVFANRA